MTHFTGSSWHKRHVKFPITDANVTGGVISPSTTVSDQPHIKTKPLVPAFLMAFNRFRSTTGSVARKILLGTTLR